MTTRLDRLFLLLDTGSTALIRRSAAEQLGEVQKLHPHELGNLLSKVHMYLRSPSWDTRIAAGQAVAAIVKHVLPWEPRGVPKHELCSKLTTLAPGILLFSHFDIHKVLSHGSSLLGSEGCEYDIEEISIGMDVKDKLIKQRQLLNKRLGLDMAGSLGIPTENIFDDEDLVMKNDAYFMDKTKKPVAEIVKQQLLDVTSGMSARERNKARRKAKLLAKQRSKEASQGDTSHSDSEPASKMIKLAVNNNDNQSEEDCLVIDVTADSAATLDEVEEWPFESFCELLMNDLFHNAWETRHGAATGLREVVKLHGQGAGKAMDTPLDQMSAMNQAWLCDLALRLLCVLALDRFGDFVSDEVVAPVRETCAQTLGVVIRLLDTEGVHGVVQALLKLLSQQQWEVRHGGLLGLKYLLAVRKNMTSELLPLVLPSIFCGLQDVDDDVRAVAATALVPVCDELVTLLPCEVPKIISCLWETLLDLDDLTASTNSIMILLSTLLAHPQGTTLHCFSQSLAELTPRLWPFLRHNIASVRKAALETFCTLLTDCHQQTPPSAWLPPILSEALRHTFQRTLLEDRADILTIVEKVWAQLLEKSPLDYLVAAATPWLGIWFCLLMQPAKLPFDPGYLIEAKHRVREQTSQKIRHVVEQQSSAKEHRDYIGGVDAYSNSPIDKPHVMQARMTGARLLGRLCKYITFHPSPTYQPARDSLAELMMFHLQSKSALQRYAMAQVIYEWASVHQNCPCSYTVRNRLLACLNESIYFDEIAISFTRMQTECRDFISGLKQQGLPMEDIFPPGVILTLEQAQSLTTTVFDRMKSLLKPKALQTFEERKQQLQVSVSQTLQEQQVLSIRVQCSLAQAVVMLDALPEKLNPVIRPLMDCIKREENSIIQYGSAICLAKLMKNCLERNPNPNAKVIKNLCTFLCCDSTNTPLVNQYNITKDCESQANEVGCDTFLGILTLTNQQKTPERSRRWLRRHNANFSSFDIPSDNTQDGAETQKILTVQRTGAECVLCTITRLFEEHLPQHVPTLWESIISPLSPDKTNEVCWKQKSEAEVQELITQLQILESVGAALHHSLADQVIKTLPALCSYLQNPYTAVRHIACRCLGMLSRLKTVRVLTYVIESVIPLLGASDNIIQRQGACEAVAHIIDQLGMDIVPYIVLLVVPTLGRMCDQNEPVRLMATHCFATLIRLLPLEAGLPDPTEMKGSLIEQKERERQFLEQLLDSSKLENYTIQTPIKAVLRKYQQDGVNWLAFLNKYKLHGILCDDMGLGKTLQSICILASDHFLRDKQFKKAGNPDCAPLPSIVVCPPTLTGHWVYEVEKFVSSQYLNPLHYTGPPGERTRLQKKVKKHNLVVASYDIVRNDIDFFGSIQWNYCVLDEGHMIKNGKTKLSKAVKQLSCNHRLILSGTPIQNNVLDLWSLFDFLMPGFLGTEKQFQARYGKPILQSRDAKSTSKEQEAGALAMEALHRQVLPFILRRLKEDVLQDLPPKILQDYYCDLSPLQVKLYEDFAKSHAKKGVEQSVYSLSEENEDKKAASAKNTTHIFQALQYLRKVCNHPALVLSPQHPKYEEITAQLKDQNSSLKEIHHAPKLTALKQLLHDCGIGVSNCSSTCGHLDANTPVVNQHRVLLFCQLKSMLNIVENDLLKTHMPNVTYLRLDGSIPAGSRHSIVNRFNNDPSIDMLLLTTHVGGLGLNLTGADTVVFVEHDWNPMKDLQAMDRAHRIGQKKVVNVYRLITRGTLEEKIMGLQKFKLTIANTVISQDNSSLQTMGTEQLLDLFILGDKTKGQSIAPRSSSNSDISTARKESIRSILDNLGELWDERQYDSEYNLDTFLKSLNA